MSEPSHLPTEIQEWVGRQLFEHVPSNIIVIDRDYRIVLSNHKFRDVFGECEQKRCFEVYKRRNDVCPECRAAACFQDGRIHTNDESGFDKEGRPAHYVVHMVPIRDQQGNISHVAEMSYDITKNREIQWRYNLLFDRVPCYVSVIDRDLRVVRCNELVRRVFGERRMERCFRLYKHRDTECEHCPARLTFEDGKPHTTKQVGMDKNGARTCFVVSTAPLSLGDTPPDLVIEMAVDITGQEKLSAELLRESRFRHLLTETALDSLVATDVADMVSIFNPAAEALFERSAKEVVGKSLGETLLPPEYLALVNGSEDRLWVPETKITSESGDDIPVRFCGTVLREGKEVIGSAVFLQDLREIKQKEKERLEHERLAAVGQTVAQLAHGIKNVLTGIQGGMYALKTGMQKNSPERIEKGWTRLERNVSRITELVKGFLSFSKGHDPSVDQVDPNEIAKSVFALFEDTAKKRGVRLELLTGQHIQPAHLDAEGIRTCLENLISNAMDACLVSDTKDKRVEIRVSDDHDVLCFDISDNGCGMDYEIKKKVFTTFFTTKGLGGTGLGLLVTQKIIQGHGGSIHVHSDPGQGSTFTIELPRSKLPPLSHQEKSNLG